jgi:hypothetical protein
MTQEYRLRSLPVNCNGGSDRLSPVKSAKAVDDPLPPEAAAFHTASGAGWRGGDGGDWRVKVSVAGNLTRGQVWRLPVTGEIVVS